jgi:hypothetical protein
MDPDFAGPSKSASNMTVEEAREAMVARTERAAELMRRLSLQCCANLARRLGGLNLDFSAVCQAPSDAGRLQRFELTLRLFDSELESMLKASALVADALHAVAAAIEACGTDDASDAWVAADDAVKKVRKARKKESHAMNACFDQLTKLDQLYEHRPPRDDF